MLNCLEEGVKRKVLSCVVLGYWQIQSFTQILLSSFSNVRMNVAAGLVGSILIAQFTAGGCCCER